MAGAFDVREPDKLALFGAQCRKHARHVQPQCQVRTVGDGFGRRTSFSSFEPDPAPVIDHQVARDPNQQGALLRRLVRRPLNAQQTQVRFLDDVLGLRHVVAHDTDDIRTQRARGPVAAARGSAAIQAFASTIGVPYREETCGSAPRFTGWSTPRRLLSP
jgi:hypothetical protein